MTNSTRHIKGSDIPDDLLLKWLKSQEPWATWMRPGGCLESAHFELTALLRRAIVASNFGEALLPTLTDEELLRIYGRAKRDHNYEGSIDNWPRQEERAATLAGLRAAIAADRARSGRSAAPPPPADGEVT